MAPHQCLTLEFKGRKWKVLEEMHLIFNEPNLSSHSFAGTCIGVVSMQLCYNYENNI